MDRIDIEMARRYLARKAKHRVDQANHRAKNKAEKRPERDDIERAALRVLLESARRFPEAKHAWIDTIARDLAKKGFREAATKRAIAGMQERLGSAD
ncbi:hypothetical protein D3273_04110 [Lichenibacterium minor]|uniref:Uncharacterized protein n=1 Tax=Lichenibacterium minor TaxID=2316528 RepID=A0A4Q2UCS4_9HYPH|nr:hypothetical protein [Lichenibacterium minor]RYC33071.1 hypothetical protein D3273_04110 [Lichenibacterium minor]